VESGQVEAGAARKSGVFRQCVSFGVKALLSVGILYFIFSRLDISGALEQARALSGRVIGLVFALLILQLAIAGLRLQWVLGALGRRLSIKAALSITMIGAFFSQTFISFLGGDGVRVWQLVRQQIPLGVALRGVLLDRVMGMLVLLLLVVLAMPFMLTLTVDVLLRTLLLLIAAGGVAGTLVLLMLKSLPPRFHYGRLINLLVEISADAHSLLLGRRYGPLCLINSLAIHLLNVAAVYALARGLSAPISLWYVVVLTPTILLLSMLPISFAGWGVREGAMVFSFGLVGVPHDQSLAVSVMFGISSLLVSLLGGAAWLVGEDRSRLLPGTPIAETAGSAGPNRGSEKSSLDLRNDS